MSRTPPHVAVWFDIPVADINRAVTFYSKVLDIKLEVSEFGSMAMAVFPTPEDAPRDVVHGALVRNDAHTPGPNGPLVYLNGGPDLAVPLARVAAAGGTIVSPKAAIGEHGYMAIFIDTEGNRLALHSYS